MSAARARIAWPSSGWARGVAIGAIVLLLVALLVAFFPWDWLRGPLNRYVSERSGRHFEITRRLDVKLGRHTRIVADGIVFANPEWATEPWLVEAERAEIDVKLWSLLLRRRVELPRVALSQPRLGLELLPDGRRTWTLEREGREDSTLSVGVMEVDRGSLRFIAPDMGADLRADFAIAGAAAQQDASVPADPLPLSFRAGGRWRGENVVGEGRTGHVLSLRGGQSAPFPVEVSVRSGRTLLHASGRIAQLADFDGAELDVELRGQSLSHLRRIAGISLPDTPPYVMRGHLRRQGALWQALGLEGTVGRTDLSGDLAYDTTRQVPLLSGELRSKLLDFDDLAPLIGLPPPPKTAAGKQATAAQRQAGARVLPNAVLDLAALRAMDADVRYAAGRIVNVRRFPLERGATHVRLQGGVLELSPLDLGFAQGRMSGLLRIDAASSPVGARLQLQARNMDLERLFPSTDTTRTSIGRVHANVDLVGRGRSVAEMLGKSDGEIVLLMGRGRISNLLLEIAGLDGAEILRFVMGKDRRVDLHCAAAAFEVKQGLAQSRALVLDTADTIIWGQGAVNFANERLDFVFNPRPKDVSILSLRSPLKLQGTLGAPEGTPDKAALAGRAAIALALGALNPLLGLAATIETGPGQDADCAAVLQQAGEAPRK
jgi:AsmA family protein